MRTLNEYVIVTARDGVDIEELAQSMNSIESACGTVGSSIARQIIEGNGKAVVKLSLIRSATDTQSGVEAIFDNFILTELRGGLPVVHMLMNDRLQS